MSHISKIELEINDIQALKQACKVLNLEFVENQTKFKRYMGVSPCSHAIRVPSANYEVGVIQKNDNYELLWDDFYAGNLKKSLGENANYLKKQYTIERVKNEARKKNYRLREQKIKGGTRIILSTQ